MIDSQTVQNVGQVATGFIPGEWQGVFTAVITLVGALIGWLTRHHKIGMKKPGQSG